MPTGIDASLSFRARGVRCAMPGVQVNSNRVSLEFLIVCRLVFFDAIALCLNPLWDCVFEITQLPDWHVIVRPGSEIQFPFHQEADLNAVFGSSRNCLGQANFRHSDIESYASVSVVVRCEEIRDRPDGPIVDFIRSRAEGRCG